MDIKIRPTQSMMDSNRKYYFEFVGAHGAGKTYTYHKLCKTDLLLPQKAIYPGQVKRNSLHFYLSCPIIALQLRRDIVFIISFFIRNAELKLSNLRVLRSLLKMSILHSYYQRFEFDILLKDERLHLLQRIYFRKATFIKKEFLNFLSYFKNIYDGIIFVSIDQAIMHARFTSRFPGKSQQFKENRASIHEHAFRQSQIMREILTEQSFIPCLFIDGGDDSNINAEAAKSFILSNLSGNPRQC